MKHIFELHPGAITGRLLAGHPDAGPASRDAEPDTEPVPASALGHLLAAVPRRRGKPQPAAAPRA